jgi:hypothetical protein
MKHLLLFFRQGLKTMQLRSVLLTVSLAMPYLAGCGEEKTVIPTAEFTEEQKKAIKAEDEKIADEESHGAKKR